MNNLKEAIDKYITACIWCLMHENHPGYATVLSRVEQAENELKRAGVSDSAINKLLNFCWEMSKTGGITDKEKQRMEVLSK